MNKQDNLCKALGILPTDLSTQINDKNPWVLHVVNGLQHLRSRSLGVVK